MKPSNSAAKAYVGDINGGSLMLNDSLILAPYLLPAPTAQAWTQLIVEQDILQRKSANTALRTAAVIRKRLAPLGEEYLNDLLKLPERGYVQLLMVALLIQSPIVEDFMGYVLAEAKRIYKPTIDKKAWPDFLDDRIRSRPELLVYSERTFKNIGANLLRALAEAGYLDSVRGKRLQPVYLLPEVKNWLGKLNRSDLISVMECTL